MFGHTSDGVRAVLGALAGSMPTFLVFVLSSVLIVVQFAAGQLTPRVIAPVFAMPLVKVAWWASSAVVGVRARRPAAREYRRRPGWPGGESGVVGEGPGDEFDAAGRGDQERALGSTKRLATAAIG